MREYLAVKAKWINFAGISKFPCHFLFSFKNFSYLCSDYEKSRNEKSRNMENPFKYGAIVDADYYQSSTNNFCRRLISQTSSGVLQSTPN